MSTYTLATPSIRIRTENPNHHLWNNHGTWFLHYTIHPTPFTKERVRRSLGTKDVAIARQRRDEAFAELGAFQIQDEAEMPAGRGPSNLGGLKLKVERVEGPQRAGRRRQPNDRVEVNALHRPTRVGTAAAPHPACRG